MEKKRMLVYANYFYPEVASTAQILTELCQGLQNDYQITVICAVPCYTGQIDKSYKNANYFFEKLETIDIIRVRVKEFDKKKKLSRIFHILSYFFRSIFATFKVGKQDIVFTISQPPILGGILGNIGRILTKGKLVYTIQDFNPEQIMAISYSKNQLLLQLLLLLDKHTCKKASLVITVGRDMQETLKQRFRKQVVPPNVVINNWMNEKEVYPLRKTDEQVQQFKKKYGLENKFVIMYSGNIGLYYDLENLIKVIATFKEEKDVCFAFVGDGNTKDDLIRYCKENFLENVVFIPYQEKKNLVYSLNAADVHLVTNAKGIKGVSVPSKIYGCMATNVPVFGILEKESEAWNLITDSNCGIVVETANYEEIRKSMFEIIKEKEKFVKQHETGRVYLEKNFTKDKSIAKYYEEIEKAIK